MERRGVSSDSVRYNEARDNIINIDHKLDRVTGRLENMNRQMDGVPRRMEYIEEDTNARNSEMDRLHDAQRLHELKLELLEKEMGYMRLNNDLLMDRMQGTDSNKKTGDYMGNEYAGEQTDRSKNSYRLDLSGDNTNEYTGEQTDRSNNFNRLDVSGDKANDQTQRYTPSPRKSTAASERKLTSSDLRALEEDRKEKEMERLAGKYGQLDGTAINPQYWDRKKKEKPWFENLPEPGGLVLLRFDDDAYGEVKVLLRSPQQSICRNSGGRVIGVARCDQINLFEDVPRNRPNWKLPRTEEQREDYLRTRNAIVAFWFAGRKSAEEFFENNHRNNHLRYSNWPSPGGHAAVYLPLNQFPPTNSSYNTFLVLEFLDAKRLYDSHDMTQFEIELRDEMSAEVPGCIPNAVAAIEGKVLFVPGPFISAYSKVFVSRFKSQRDAERIWKLGMIQGLRQKWRMPGPISVFCFTLDDMV